MQRCYIGLGANLGDPPGQLRGAIRALRALADCRLGPLSPLYRSSPLGPQDQPDFFNAVAALDSTLPPLDLLDALQRIEAQAGRVRGRRWGPRTLDLDLLLYGNRAMDTPRLTVPHPGLYERAFVLWPLADLCGENYRLPRGEDIGTLKRACPGPAPVRQAEALGAVEGSGERDGDK
ncbi:2-amino-4-hydroxy-6-hydroxymethyldihydropteridine diphosphokinase [Pseudohaliea rubra]|uniref:2-amino-4-hydroxy-6-hydroxymethyldihydropteridine pyrophosphokinase n=1 Tax=Pseudohaliea rubra DSM 19751 TaxID=1265313 RepID=A0A095VNN3_9GAMM|nr:2-amino-4-hydroxy-6-hydroxymethyldihydropteridine diphosphokinase [Pseudohaliea rubra]KGE02708.1 2-amino-4-hydroxy-6- hydroxymethyldihydropteridine pyrophosphokinase [Pseudohaliea rubra DSM 19751]